MRIGDDNRQASIYSIYVLMLLSSANALSYADRQLFAILASAIKAEFEISDAMIGALGGAIFMVPYILLGIPVARLADRWSRRKVLGICIAVWSLMSGACGLATNLPQLIAARMGVGVGEAGGSPPAQSMIVDMFPPERRAAALAIFTSGTYVGMVIAMWGGALLAVSIGWRATFLVLAVPGPLIGLLIWLTGPCRRTDVSASGQLGMWAVVRLCWEIPTFRLICYAAGALGIFTQVAAMWMPSYFLRSHGVSLPDTGFWVAFSGLSGGILGTLASGAMADRLQRHSIRWLLLIPALGMACAAPMFMLQLLMPAGEVLLGTYSVPLVALPGPVSFFFLALWMPPSFAVVGNLLPAGVRSQAVALLLMTLTVVGAGLGPVLAGLVSDLLTRKFGVEALRWSILGSTSTLIASAFCFWRASLHYPTDIGAAREHPVRTEGGVDAMVASPVQAR